MFGALVKGAVKLGAVAAVAVAANEAWQAVKPAIVAKAMEFAAGFNADGAEEDEETGFLRQRAAEAAREAFPSLFPKGDAANV